MFCNKCGAGIEVSSQYCPRCGTAVPATAQETYAAPAIAQHGESKLARRLSLLVALWIIYGVIEIGRAAALHFFARVARFWWTGPDWAQWAGPWVSFWLVTWLLCSAVLAFVAAWGLHERAYWGRVAAILAAIFALAHPPFGTLLGIYTLVVLLSRDAGTQYQRMTRA